MKLSRVKIQNFRGIAEIEFFPQDYTSLIGPNNAGKSTILRAVQILLGQLTPERDEWRQGHEDEPIVIEGDFEQLQDWERNKSGVSGLVYDNRIRLRMIISPRAEEDPKKKQTAFESFRQSEQIDGWADKWSDLATELQELGKTNGMTGRDFNSNAGKEKLRTLIRDKLPGKVTLGQAGWSSDGVSIPAALQQALPDVQLIPAVRDAAEDGAPGAKTSFGLLVKKMVLPAVKDSDEYKRLLSAVGDLQGKLRGDNVEQLAEVKRLTDQISLRLSTLIPAKVSLTMDPPDAERFVGANTTLQLDDGTRTRIPLQGHGLQRALIFAMLEVLAMQNARGEGGADEPPPPSRSIVLLFEEPELFIHPHLMRRLKSALMALSQGTDWQVIISTHSPFLVDVATDPRALVILRRDSPTSPTTVSQVQDDIFGQGGRTEERERLRAVLDFHPTVCEAFFARRTILVEGDTELAALVAQPDVCMLAGIDSAIQQDTSIVSCDGKWTIVPMARILKALGVPVRVVHDTDRKEQTPDQLRDTPSTEYQANARIAEVVGDAAIFRVDDTFEDVLWSGGDRPASSKDKPYRAWKRIRELCKDRENLDHAPKLRDLLKFCYADFQ